MYQGCYYDVFSNYFQDIHDIILDSYDKHYGMRETIFSSGEKGDDHMPGDLFDMCRSGSNVYINFEVMIVDNYVTALYGILMSVYGVAMCIRMMVGCIHDSCNTKRASVILINIMVITIFIFLIICFLALAVWAVVTYLI